MLRLLITLILNVLVLGGLYLVSPNINFFYTGLLCIMFVQIGTLSSNVSQLAEAISYLLAESLEKRQKEQQEKIEEITKHFK